MQSDDHGDELISMTLWDKQEDAQAYEKSGLFQKLHAQVKPFLNASSEWKIQLSEDFTLEFDDNDEEPVVISYPIVEVSNPDICGEESQRMYTRIVSAKIQPGKLEEFKKLYREEILPTLRGVEGCRYAYLTESDKEKNEVFSVTIWNSKKHADDYENSGQFDDLTDRVKHTLSELYQWKMALEKDLGKKLATSADLKVDHYSMVAGKRFY